MAGGGDIRGRVMKKAKGNGVSKKEMTNDKSDASRGRTRPHLGVPVEVTASERVQVVVPDFGKEGVGVLAVLVRA
jgi:hypothetical protein